MSQKTSYHPNHFLAALGAGGLAISFFMYPMFLVPHKGVPMATFDFIFPVLMKGTIASYALGLSLFFIALFLFFHFKLLIWNIKEYAKFKKTEAFSDLIKGNGEVTLMAIPLTLTMTINACFIAGAVFVPKLWTVVEYMFPAALVAMALAGFFALKIFGKYVVRVFLKGGFNFEMNNNLSQLLAVFTFTMVGVSFAAPGAMSKNIAINVIGISLSIFFISLAVLVLIPKFVLAMNSIIKHGISEETSPSLWILIPILTLIGIAIVRIDMGIFHHFEHHIHDVSHALTQTSIFVTTTIILSIQIIFGLVGYAVMKKLNYFKDYVNGSKNNPASLALVCPGVAFFVFGMFYIHYGLGFSGIIGKYSVVAYVLTVPLMYIQYKTVTTFFKLKNKLI